MPVKENTPKAYTGNEPYIFFSYSHKDKNKAAKRISELMAKGYRVWYDEGIIPSEIFSREIAERVLRCCVFIALISKNYLDSTFCMDELEYARRMEKRCVLLYIEDVQLPPEHDLHLGKYQAIKAFKIRNSDKELETLSRVTGIDDCQISMEIEEIKDPPPPPKPSKRWIPALCVTALIGLGILYYSELFSPFSTASQYPIASSSSTDSPSPTALPSPTTSPNSVTISSITTTSDTETYVLNDKGDFVYYEVIEDGSISIICFSGESTVIVIPEQIEGKPITAIGKLAFASQRNLLSVTIPDSVTRIGGGAFSNCVNLRTINVPTSLTTIGEEAFSFCKELSSFSISERVTSIGRAAFSRSLSMKSIEVDSNNPKYVSIDGVLYTRNMKTLLAFPGGKEVESFCLPDGVETIGRHAFCGNDYLVNVIIPEGVKTIEDNAFDDCHYLQSIEIPSSVTNIDFNTFFRCTSLESVSLPDGLSSIPERLFQGCTSLTSVRIPKSVQTIADSAFVGCTSLYRVYYTGTESEWGKIEPGIRNAINSYSVQFNSK